MLLNKSGELWRIVSASEIAPWMELRTSRESSLIRDSGKFAEMEYYSFQLALGKEGRQNLGGAGGA